MLCIGGALIWYRTLGNGYLRVVCLREVFNIRPLKEPGKQSCLMFTPDFFDVQIHLSPIYTVLFLHDFAFTLFLKKLVKMNILAAYIFLGILQFLIAFFW